MELMIQNELLPGCAIQMRYDGKWKDEIMIDFEMIGWGDLYNIRPITLTDSTVCRIDGFDQFKFYINEVFSIFIERDTMGVYIETIERDLYLPHIKSIHQLQKLIGSLKGRIPKYKRHE